MASVEPLLPRASVAGAASREPGSSPAAEALLTLALGNEEEAAAPRAPRAPRLQRKLSDCRLLSRGPVCAVHGQRRRANVRREHRSLGLFLRDLYHVFLEVPWRRLVLLFCLTYILAFASFALVYWLSCDRCNLGCRSFVDAMLLSVETMMTIGYGVPDPYFKSCPWLVAVIVAQCFLSAAIDASLVGVMYQRMSAGGRRSATILFSDKAVIRTVGGNSYFMFQVCEMRRLQLLECHVRCYLFTRPLPEARAGRAPAEMRPLRLDQPDDAMGAMLLLVLPTAVVHRIDAFSPLWAELPSDSGGGAVEPCCPAGRPLGGRSCLVPPQRSSECDVGSRYGLWCDACGECFQLAEQLRRHVRYSARLGAAVDPAHAALLERLPREPSPAEARERVRELFRTRFAEVVCFIEGIDPVTSSNVQARHSYTADDIAWDARFAECAYDAVFESGDAGLCIDFERFHELLPC